VSPSWKKITTGAQDFPISNVFDEPNKRQSFLLSSPPIREKIRCKVSASWVCRGNTCCRSIMLDSIRLCARSPVSKTMSSLQRMIISRDAATAQSVLPIYALVHCERLSLATSSTQTFSTLTRDPASLPCNCGNMRSYPPLQPPKSVPVSTPELAAPKRWHV
jgi:hypothetical protein